MLRPHIGQYQSLEIFHRLYKDEKADRHGFGTPCMPYTSFCSLEKYGGRLSELRAIKSRPSVLKERRHCEAGPGEQSLRPL